MNFKEYLTLCEDEGGDAGVTADVGTVDQNNTPAETTPQPGNLSTNMSGWSAPIGYISRIAMPQIPREMFGEFLNDLKINNIGYKLRNFKAKELVPTQGEFNAEKVNSIKTSIKDGSYIHDPILVTDKNHIADGHHRWAAFDPDSYIVAHHVELPFEDLYKFLDNKPYVLKRSIKQ